MVKTLGKKSKKQISCTSVVLCMLLPFVFCPVLCRVNLQNSKQKLHTTKNFARFFKPFPLLTMLASDRTYDH